MTQKDTGGPAFPPSVAISAGGEVVTKYGMTLRDWFAGQALVGYLSANQKWDDGASAAAKAAYYMADAMIAEREAK